MLLAHGIRLVGRARFFVSWSVYIRSWSVLTAAGSVRTMVGAFRLWLGQRTGSQRSLRFSGRSVVFFVVFSLLLCFGGG